MIIAWWSKENPQAIELIEDSDLPWINANWVEKRQADEEEIRLYKKGIHRYGIRKNGITFYGKEKNA